MTLLNKEVAMLSYLFLLPLVFATDTTVACLDKNSYVQIGSAKYYYKGTFSCLDASIAVPCYEQGKAGVLVGWGGDKANIIVPTTKECSTK